MRRCGLIVGLLLVAVFAASAQAATTLHVNGVGGQNSGDCASSPCRTIAYAVSEVPEVSAPVTIDVAAGTYDELVELGSADSGLTIDGVGDGTNPNTDTIIEAPSGEPGIITDVGGTDTSLTLENLSLSQPNGAPAVLGDATAVDTTDVGIDVTGEGLAFDLDGGSVTTSGGSITLSSATSGQAIDLSGTTNSVRLTGTPVSFAAAAVPAIQADAVTLTNSPVTSTSTSAAGAPVIDSAAGLVTVTDSPIDLNNEGTAIDAVGSVNVTGSQLTSENMSDGSQVIDSQGTVSVSGAPIVDDGTGEVIAAPAADLSDVQITQGNPSVTGPTLSLAAGPSSLSKVTITTDTSAPVLYTTGSVAISGSAITSDLTTGASQALELTGSTSTTSDISLTGTKVVQSDSAVPIAQISDANAAFDSSELLGGQRTVFSAQTGKTNTLTIASSTIDVGQLGVRDSATDGFASVAAEGGSSGTDAVVNIEGSILVEAPEASGDASVNCSYTEVPFTTQDGINCGDANGNTYTQSLSAIFQDPGVNYIPNPSWNGVDSVPASAISLPSPFADSSTDVLGNPRVVNGEGTCTPGIRDKGAIELQGHAGVVPDPLLSGSSTATVGKLEIYSAKAANTSAQFSWTSSDGGKGSGASFAHKFKRAGKFTVTVTATGAADCVGRTSKTVTVVGIDAITRLSVSPKKVKKKAAIGYRASASATTTLTIEIKSRKGYKVVKRLTHKDKAGKVKVTFKRGKLKAGRYRIEAQSMNAAGKSKPVYAKFTIGS
jgi:PKD domain